MILKNKHINSLPPLKGGFLFLKKGFRYNKPNIKLRKQSCAKSFVIVNINVKYAAVLNFINSDTSFKLCLKGWCEDERK